MSPSTLSLTAAHTPAQVAAQPSHSNTLSAILSHWYPRRDQCDWVLATLIQSRGSSYRKLGARLLINQLGERFGLLSGGCLETDLVRQAARVFTSREPRLVSYDMLDDGGERWQQAIGCGGELHIGLCPLHQDNHYLGFDQVYQALRARESVWYRLALDLFESSANTPKPSWQLRRAPGHCRSRSRRVIRQQQPWLLSRLTPAPHLMVFGGGIDARPLVAMAAQLGWQVTLIDRRSRYAPAEHFPAAGQIIRAAATTLKAAGQLDGVDAAVVLNHNLELDAEALQALAHSSVRYLGLLGPAHRRERLLALAGLTPADLPTTLHGPAGLALGGDLPESIALSILAQCHRCLFGGGGALG